ncbi:WRKY19 [Symbiodinium sp. CCMP2456]|nr:WRKY19 [Symbiodinium sp. CCMP2456]
MPHPKHFCVQPTPVGPCGERAVLHGKCREHGGNRRLCLNPTPDGPCQKQVQWGGEVPACFAHGGGERCLRPTSNGPCQKQVSSGGAVRACKAHGGGKRLLCLHPTPAGPCHKLAAKAGVRACIAHGGGKLCLRPTPAGPCQKHVQGGGERAQQLIWDCPVPGGCTLKRPDMLFRFEDRFVQVEVDEEGHENLSCADEDSRLELIAADVGLPGLVLRLNPDAERVLKRRRLSNGEHCFCVGDADAFNGLFDAAEAAVEAFANEPAPEGVRVVGLPASWWDGR